MKHFSALFFFLLTFFCFRAIAKGPGADRNGIQFKNPVIAGQKTSGTGQRYLASMESMSDGTVLVPADSSRWMYVDAFTTNLSVENEYGYDGSAWGPSFNYIYTYDAMNYLIRRDDGTWNAGTSSYDKYGQTSYINDANGYPTDLVVKYWNAGTSAYVNSLHQITTRTASSFITDVVSQHWNVTAWRNYSHESYILNAQNNFTTHIHQSWDTLANAWVNKTKTDVTYDASGLHGTGSTEMTWNTATTSWKNSTLSTNFLNSAGNADSSTYKIWNTGSATYDNSSRSTYTYDGAGNETSEIEQDYSGGIWSNSYKVLYTYTSANQEASYTLLIWDSGAFGTGSGSTRTVYYFESYTPTGIAAPGLTAKLGLSPNPVKDVLNISLQMQQAQDFSATIMNMEGRVCQRLSGSAGKDLSTTMNVSELPAGNYILSVKGAKGESAAKMISVMH